MFTDSLTQFEKCWGSGFGVNHLLLEEKTLTCKSRRSRVSNRSNQSRSLTPEEMPIVPFPHWGSGVIYVQCKKVLLKEAAGNTRSDMLSDIHLPCCLCNGVHERKVLRNRGCSRLWARVGFSATDGGKTLASTRRITPRSSKTSAPTVISTCQAACVCVGAHRKYNNNNNKQQIRVLILYIYI